MIGPEFEMSEEEKKSVAEAHALLSKFLDEQKLGPTERKLTDKLVAALSKGLTGYVAEIAIARAVFGFERTPTDIIRVALNGILLVMAHSDKVHGTDEQGSK